MHFWHLYLLLLASTCFARNWSLPTKRITDRTDDVQWYYPVWYNRPGSSDSDETSSIKKTSAIAAYQEAVVLAGLVYESLVANRDDPIFLRYFEASDYRLVKDIYASIAGVIDRNYNRGSPLIQILQIYDGPSPWAPTICDGNPTPYAAILQNWKYTPAGPINVPGLPADAAALSLCPRFYLMPLLAQRNCRDIYGDNDNILMGSRGALFLHELVHWRTLTQQADDFSSVIQREKGLDHINDFAYGPLDTHARVAHQNGDAVINADNYRWYASSNYWRKTCPEKNNGQGWGTAVDRLRPGPSTGDCPDVYDVQYTDSEPK